MIVVFTGDGKGKTTASLGQAVRVLGRGKRVLMIQFIKGPWISGENEFVKRVKRHGANVKEMDEKLYKDLENIYDFDIRKMGLGFVGILGDQLPKEEHAKAGRVAFDSFEKELKKDWDMIILDEINVAVSLGLLDIGWILEILKLVPEEKIVDLTGRNAPPEFIELADLATEMKEIKHPFAKGKMAKINVEF